MSPFIDYATECPPRAVRAHLDHSAQSLRPLKPARTLQPEPEPEPEPVEPPRKMTPEEASKEISDWMLANGIRRYEDGPLPTANCPPANPAMARAGRNRRDRGGLPISKQNPLTPEEIAEAAAQIAAEELPPIMKPDW